MKKLAYSLLIVLGAILSTHAAYAEDEGDENVSGMVVYGGVGAGYLDIDLDRGETKGATFSVFTLGVEYGGFISSEYQYTWRSDLFGTDNGDKLDVEVNGATVGTYSLETHGLWPLVLKTPGSVYFKGKLGGVYVEDDISVSGIKVRPSTDSSLLAGAGVGLGFRSDTGQAEFEYQYIDGLYEALTASIAFRF